MITCLFQRQQRFWPKVTSDTYVRIPATDLVNAAVPGLQDPVNMAVSAPPQKSAPKRVYAPELQLATARTFRGIIMLHSLYPSMVNMGGSIGNFFVLQNVHGRVAALKCSAACRTNTDKYYGNTIVLY